MRSANKMEDVLTSYRSGLDFSTCSFTPEPLQHDDAAVRELLRFTGSTWSLRTGFSTRSRVPTAPEDRSPALGEAFLSSRVLAHRQCLLRVTSRTWFTELWSGLKHTGIRRDVQTCAALPERGPGHEARRLLLIRGRLLRGQRRDPDAGQRFVLVLACRARTGPRGASLG